MRETQVDWSRHTLLVFPTHTPFLSFEELYEFIAYAFNFCTVLLNRILELNSFCHLEHKPNQDHTTHT